LSTEDLKRWKRRGRYAEQVLVRKLKKLGFLAVRVPTSNPSLNPLPDVFARKGYDVFAFEVKSKSYYAYFDKHQIAKLFEFLKFFPVSDYAKHAILAGHFGKKWVFKEVSRKEFEKLGEEESICILKRDRGNWKLKD